MDDLTKAAEGLSATDANEYAILSNGMKVFVGHSFGDLDRTGLEMAERLIASGHKPACDEDGVVDFFFTNGGYCNGPGCSDCHDSACMHCSPDWQPDPCEGPDGYAAEQKARRHAEFLKLKAEFEPSGIPETPKGNQP